MACYSPTVHQKFRSRICGLRCSVRTSEQEHEVEWAWRERLMEGQRQQVALPQPDYSR